MRRLRPLFTLGSGVSLLLFVIVAAAMLVSFVRAHSLTWNRIASHPKLPKKADIWHRHDHVMVATARGGFFVEHSWGWTNGTYHFWHEPDIQPDHTLEHHVMPNPIYPIYPDPPPGVEDEHANFAGFQFGSRVSDYRQFDPALPPLTGGDRSLTVPAWCPLVLLAILPTFRLVRCRRRWRVARRLETGQCLVCGYNLRSGGQATCPECGMIGEAGVAETPTAS
jgi:hypothetical protein